MRGVTLFPYWGVLRLLHQPLKFLYFLVWSHGNTFSSLGQVSRGAVLTTRVTSMFVRPSAKSSMLTLMRLPVTWRLMRVLAGLGFNNKMKRYSTSYLCVNFHSFGRGSLTLGANWEILLMCIPAAETCLINWGQLCWALKRQRLFRGEIGNLHPCLKRWKKTVKYEWVIRDGLLKETLAISWSRCRSYCFPRVCILPFFSALILEFLSPGFEWGLLLELEELGCPSSTAGGWW